MLTRVWKMQRIGGSCHPLTADRPVLAGTAAGTLRRRCSNGLRRDIAHGLGLHHAGVAKEQEEEDEAGARWSSK